LEKSLFSGQSGKKVYESVEERNRGKMMWGEKEEDSEKEKKEYRKRQGQMGKYRRARAQLKKKG